MTGYIKSDGAWRRLNDMYIRSTGQWFNLDKGWVRSTGQWFPIHDGWHQENGSDMTAAQGGPVFATGWARDYPGGAIPNQGSQSNRANITPRYDNYLAQVQTTWMFRNNDTEMKVGINIATYPNTGESGAQVPAWAFGKFGYQGHDGKRYLLDGSQFTSSSGTGSLSKARLWEYIFPNWELIEKAYTQPEWPDWSASALGEEGHSNPTPISVTWV